MSTPTPAQPHAPGPHAPGPGRLAERLLARIAEHLEVARAIDKLSEAQSLCVRGGDTAGVLDALAQREPLIARVLRLNDELAPLVAALNAGGPAAAGLGPAQVQGVLADLREIDRLMSAISQRDRDDETALSAQRAAVAQQLSGVLTGADALSAYGQLARPAQAQPRFQDRQA